MPELPEVETIVRGLTPRLAGRRILNAEFCGPEAAAGRILRGDLASLAGLTINLVTRHGKFVLFGCRGGLSFGIHLGMTGKLLLDATPGPHTHAVLTLEDGVLLYDDIRQFGRIEVGPALGARLSKLGPDPLLISEDQFIERLRARRSMVKPLLLNQTFLRGLGNIYADETLYRAGIHPRATSATLSRPRSAKLFAAIQIVLNESIATGGSSVSDYVDAEGRKGGFQLQHRVYGKEGESCPTCGALIRRIVLGQRGTHYCPRCQKR